jgi:hypothetical protein
VSACGQFRPERPVIDLRYRLEIGVRVADEVHLGASVLSMRWEDIGGEANFNGGDRFLRFPLGEAVVIDVGEHGKLFGLLHSPPLDPDEGGWGVSGPRTSDVPRALSRPFTARSPESVLIPLLPEATRDTAGDGVALRQMLGDLAGVYALPREHWPVMVRFRDESDASSVELIERDNLSGQLGDGSSIERVTVEVVSAQVTRHIERDLPWLAGHRGALTRPTPGQAVRSLAQRINHTHFILTEDDWA